MAWSSLHPLPGGPGLQACPPTARDIPHTHTQAVAGPGMELQLGARPDNGYFSHLRRGTFSQVKLHNTENR